MGGSIGGGASAGLWSGGAGTWTNAINSSTATYTAGASETGSITLTATGGLQLLLSFNVEAEGCFAYITWSTVSEINNDYFSIEYSYDGVDWTEINKVYGAGNSNEVIHYSHYDFDCFHNQLVYYRIVQVDFDGTKSSSKVKPLNVVKPYTVKIFPNPTKENTTVEINAEFGDRTGNVVVRNMSGQKVFSKSIVNGKNQLNLMQLAPDTYIIKVSAPDQLPYYEKLVILK